jgi:hypothetical protein
VVKHGIAGESRLDIRILDITRELGLHLDILAVAVRPDAFVALSQILRVQRIGIEIDVADDRHEIGVYGHGASSLSRRRYPFPDAAIAAVLDP